MTKKYDLQLENFDRLFSLKMGELTPEERQKLPEDLAVRVYGKNFINKLHHLPFFEKMYALLVVKNARMFIHIEDENGVSIADFEKHKKDIKNGVITQEQTDVLIQKTTFVVSSKELVEWLYYLNEASLSGAYNFGTKIRNSTKVTFPKLKQEVLYFVNLISKYETGKKRILRDMGLDTSCIFVLLYLYDGKEKAAKDAYTNLFHGACGCNRVQMLRAFRLLVAKGYIALYGKYNKTTYKITALGLEVFNKIIHKYMIP